MNDETIIKKRIKFLQRAFSDSSLDKDGLNVSIHCVNKKCSTFGKSHKRKLALRVDNEFFHCWVCGFSGKGLLRFIKQYSPRFAEAASEIFQTSVKEQEIVQNNDVFLPQDFKLLATVTKKSDPDIIACKNYVIQRGLSEKQLWYFKLGAVSQGKLRRRIIIPSFDDKGDLNYYTARSIDDVTQKYINPKIKRSDIIFNEINIDWSEELVLVEGPFDLFKSTQNSTCILGSTLTESHLLFKRIVENKTPVILALDPDASTKTRKIASLLYSYDVNVRILDTNPYADVGEMPVGKINEFIQKSFEWSTNDKIRSLISTIKSGSLI